MNNKQLIEYLDTFMSVESGHPFGPEALVYKVKGKMFAILSEREGREYVTVKVKPEDGEVLTGQFNDITPGYYTNKKHWVTVYYPGDVEDGLIQDLCERSYELVVSKLPKGQRVQLGYD
ncbi:MmcQ/YjbR family DNA-binding protein [Vibrio sp. Isolate25]|uniref:MmcQ/YjbR family DNA-binding protein n=1 Tax=Vibrio TaxID=662 RepID=UPI001EFDDD1B|nr:MULTISPECIES: MmcQ/YjbR family DNA-binding protein [Vibrio]MCG9595766.1 MmcQ/YjbR family DNA-binding protein [Vibrio sp. Isolate25]MCG9685006.1 MmcQ/YjbR family DNA-binding protein [Vibrio sp. Isolate23]USD35321.1 MmcQ/YjbR family DNA-binding protein [Vibrio sp. SCSIO 43186]USD48388.1 MmcQ/YjbR family DNA-binding protein [Vibrio sp. SCSIO 43145]USD72446.1 MmcQ/YjbR family DNA-binding protein [Vibrio sp. SCSIO 43139]